MSDSSDDTGQKPVQANQEYAWKLYELLSGILQHYHSRWIDNYKVFLSFNSFLLPAATALLAYALKENQSTLRLFVALLCVVGAVAAWQSMGLLQRIHLDNDLRFNQLRRLEQMMADLPICPFTEGHAYFFSEAPLPPIPGNTPIAETAPKKRGTQAIKAYRMITRAILLAYAFLFLYSIWPFKSVIMDYFSICR